MGNITLRGYKSIVENEVFKGHAHPIRNPETKKKTGEDIEVVYISKFRVPTEKEVIECLGKNIRKAHSRRDKPKFSTRDLEGCVNSIMKHYKSELQEGRIYVEALRKLFPPAVLKLLNEARENKRIILYNRTIERLNIEKQRIRIRLCRGVMPKRKELEYLLERGVRESDILSMQGQGDVGEYKTLADLARLVNDALQSTELITKLRDASDYYKEKKADETVEKFNNTHKLEELEEISRHLLLGMVEGIKQQAKREDQAKGYSLN